MLASVPGRQDTANPNPVTGAQEKTEERPKPTKVLTALEKKQKMEQERLEKIRLIEEEKRRRMEQALLRKQKEEDEKKKRQEENKHKMVEKQKHAKDIEQNRIQKILEVSERPFIPFFLITEPSVLTFTLK